jgi:hypothetical protein
MNPLSSSQQTSLGHWIAALIPASNDERASCVSATAESLLALITARPWRRSSVDPDTAADLSRKVNRALREDKPIEFSLPFGGYRGWQLPSYPNLDWAEVFWVRHLHGYAQRIARVHPPGVVLSLSHVGGVLAWVNGLPQADLDRYLGQLDALLRRFSTSRVHFRLVDHSLACGGSAVVLAQLEAEASRQPAPDQAALARAERNLLWTGSTPPPMEVIDRAARRCAALMALGERRAFNKFGPRIQLTHLRGPSLSLHIGSCRSAVAQPWVSSGYLRWRQDRREWIESLATTSVSLQALLSLSIHHPLLDLSPTLARLPLQLTDLPIDDERPGDAPAPALSPHA